MDRHLVYAATSPQALEGLRITGRRPWRRETVIATVDHNVPTTPAERASIDAIADPLSRTQVRQLAVNCREFGITQFGITSRNQGIMHVVGPEQGATLPGMTVVGGDSHITTHGASAALAFGVGKSDVEHVLATQTLYKRASAAVTDLVGGQVQVSVQSLPSSISFIKSGKLKVLGVVNERRVSALPDVPTIGETIKGFGSTPWYGLLAPAGTPKAVVAQLEAAVAKVLDTPDTKEKLAAVGCEPAKSTHEQFAALIKEHLPKWAKIVKDSGATID